MIQLHNGIRNDKLEKLSRLIFIDFINSEEIFLMVVTKARLQRNNCKLVYSAKGIHKHQPASFFFYFLYIFFNYASACRSFETPRK